MRDRKPTDVRNHPAHNVPNATYHHDGTEMMADSRNLLPIISPIDPNPTQDYSKTMGQGLKGTDGNGIRYDQSHRNPGSPTYDTVLGPTWRNR